MAPVMDSLSILGSEMTGTDLVAYDDVLVHLAKARDTLDSIRQVLNHRKSK
jgi:hypothetical protein